MIASEYQAGIAEKWVRWPGTSGDVHFSGSEESSAIGGTRRSRPTPERPWGLGVD